MRGVVNQNYRKFCIGFGSCFIGGRHAIARDLVLELYRGKIWMGGLSPSLRDLLSGFTIALAIHSLDPSLFSQLIAPFSVGWFHRISEHPLTPRLPIFQFAGDIKLEINDMIPR